MITDIAAVVASIAVVAGLCWAVYGWFKLSLNRFHRVVAKDVLAGWDAQLATLSADDREELHAQPQPRCWKPSLLCPPGGQGVSSSTNPVSRLPPAPSCTVRSVTPYSTRAFHRAEHLNA
jgi:hypothetical protein